MPASSARRRRRTKLVRNVNGARVTLPISGFRRRIREVEKQMKISRRHRLPSNEIRLRAKTTSVYDTHPMGSWNAMIRNRKMTLLRPVVFVLLIVSVAATVASNSIVGQTEADYSAAIRNGRGELCAFTATEPGRYQLSGLAKRPWHQPYCTVYVRGPPHTRIRLTFDLDGLDCDKSVLSVYDGWRVFDWLKKKHYSLPDDEFEENEKAEGGRRQFDLCYNPNISNGRRISMQTSQNVGQVFYRFARKDSAVVTVEFIEDEQMCNVFISDKVEGLYKISNGGKAGVCKWYISGALIVTLKEVHLLNSTGELCENSSNFLQFQSSGVSWRLSDIKLEQRFCHTEEEQLDYLLPCKFNRVELHTDEADGVEQWVTFALERPSEMEKEPFTYYCF